MSTNIIGSCSFALPAWRVAFQWSNNVIFTWEEIVFAQHPNTDHMFSLCRLEARQLYTNTNCMLLAALSGRHEDVPVTTKDNSVNFMLSKDCVLHLM